MSTSQAVGIAKTVATRGARIGGWQRWAPYAAVGWSLIYAALGVYWAAGGRGFPYAPNLVADGSAPLAGQFGPGVAWVIVIVAGLPAAALGTAMLRALSNGMLRSLFIVAAALLVGTLLLLMTSLSLLVMSGYIPYAVVKLLSGAELRQGYWAAWTQWTLVHQMLCLLGGFLWLAATVSYARRSGNACLQCGRRDGMEGWTSPHNAARWGKIAVYVSLVVPVYYALPRFAWALGIPVGMSQEQWRQGQESGLWISGLFLAVFGLVGAGLTLGLVQRWGEVFPRWMPGLAGRRVPIALAVAPALIASVLFTVGGLAMWPGYAQMSAAARDSGQNMALLVGPVALFPVWGVSLAVAALGYYYRRRGPCSVCGRGE